MLVVLAAAVVRLRVTTIRRLLAALPAGVRVADVPDFQGGPRLAAAAELSQTRAMTWRDYAGDFFHPGDRGYQRCFRAFLGPDVSEYRVLDQPGQG